MENCRNVTPVAKHLNRAFILGKRPRYFQEPDFAWPEGIFEDLTNEIGGGFEFVGAAGVKGVDDMPMKGIENLGKMDKDDWNSEVAKSAVMVCLNLFPGVVRKERRAVRCQCLLLMLSSVLVPHLDRLHVSSSVMPRSFADISL